MSKTGSARRRARRMRESGVDPVSFIAPRPRVNPAALRKQTAETFLRLLQSSDQIPTPCPDGILPARFGDWVWLMQFENGQVVGVIMAHLSEATAFINNFDRAAGGTDFAALLNVALKAEDPLLVEDLEASVPESLDEEPIQEDDPASLTPPV